MTSKIYQPFIERRKIREFLAHTHISAKNRYIYFGVSKAANSTIKYFLQQLEYLGTPYKVKNVHHKHLSPLLSPYQLGDADLESALYGDEFTRFTMVRNPYSRLLSCFLDRVQDEKSASYKVLSKGLGLDPKKITFSDFIEVVGNQDYKDMDCHWRPQVHEIYFDLLSFTKILKFEDLPNNLSELKFLTGTAVDGIFESNQNKSPSVTAAADKFNEYYDQKSIARVQQIYANDFEKLGYSFTFGQ